MDRPLDELYLEFLYRQVASIRFKNPARTYWSLLRHLYSKEFVSLVPNDDNRVEDGRDLRNEFIDSYEVIADRHWMALGCSMLEMLIGLARRLEFEADNGDVSDWFWALLENIGLRHFSDGYYHDHRGSRIDRQVEDILDRVIYRKYDRNGRGGLFPLEHATRDQRRVELWYQMSQFLLER